MPDAGIYEPHAKFGEIKQKMTLGGKYKREKKKEVPDIGAYDPESGVAMTKPRGYEAMILPKEQPKRWAEPTPDGGQYDPHTNFGEFKQNMTLGGKYKDELTDNPAPG